VNAFEWRCRSFPELARQVRREICKGISVHRLRCMFVVMKDANARRRASRIIITAVTLLVAPLLYETAQAGQSSAAERSYSIPCEADLFAQSGDGRTIWFVCKAPSQIRSEIETEAARKEKKTPPPPPATSQLKRKVYALEIRSGKIKFLTRTEGSIDIDPAPVGAQMVLVRTGGDFPLVLYSGARKLADLPLTSWTSNCCVWSSDGRMIYFNHSSLEFLDAIEVLTLDGMRISHKKLSKPAEYVSVCQANGHVFTGDDPPVNDKLGLVATMAAEYDPDVNLIRPQTNFLVGEFSATCRSVATPEGDHGPIPRYIIDVETGEHLQRFDFYSETENRTQFDFRAWNPKRDEIFLRGGDDDVLEVFNLKSHAVVDSFREPSWKAIWSTDGRSLIMCRGKALVFRAMPAWE
jgi:hypothetical protein